MFSWVYFINNFKQIYFTQTINALHEFSEKIYKSQLVYGVDNLQLTYLGKQFIH
jgi:hypothetical protein